MTKTNTNSATAFCSMDFFHYLQERPTERYSRFEAYLYMLDKAITSYRPDNIEKKWIPAIGEGQFFITKSELANDWHWHRATVRDYLAKLSEYGCLVVEEHLKGILCTMTRLVVTVNDGIAVAYSFDSMAKYTMYSWAGGTLKSVQVDRIIRQMERGASTMLNGTFISPYLEKELEGVTTILLHYCIEAALAHLPTSPSFKKELLWHDTNVERRLAEFFAEHLGGSWVHLLSLMTKDTEVALKTLLDSVHKGRSERAELFSTLREYAEIASSISLPAVNVAEESVPADTDSVPEDNNVAPEDIPVG